MSAPRGARPCGRATKRTYCRRRLPPAAPDTGRQSPVQQGTVVGRSRQVTATGLDPEAVLNEPIVRCLKKIGCAHHDITSQFTSLSRRHRWLGHDDLTTTNPAATVRESSHQPGWLTPTEAAPASLTAQATQVTVGDHNYKCQQLIRCHHAKEKEG